MLPHVDPEHATVLADVGDGEGHDDGEQDGAPEQRHAEHWAAVQRDHQQRCQKEVVHIARDVPGLEHALQHQHVISVI